MNDKPKIVIAGAGPAGCAASLFLSQEGIPHILMDKATFPRDKVCGDALSGKVFSHLKHVLPEIYHDFSGDPKHYTPSYGVKFVAPNGKALDVPFAPGLTQNDPSPGFISKRIDFDNYIFHKAATSNYAEVRLGTEVKQIRKEGSIYQIDIRQNGSSEIIYTPLLIDCCGDRSPNASLWGETKHISPERYSAGLRRYYHGVTGFHDMNFIELHFIKDFLPGYFWIFPLPDGRANVGVGMLSKDVSGKKINLKARMQDIIDNHPEISPRFKNAVAEEKTTGWGLPLGRKKIPLSKEGLMRCGDAGALIDPFTGEGIGNAVLSGRYAGIQAAAAWKQENFSADFLKEYDRKVYKKVGSELRLSSTLLDLCRYPRLFNMVVNKSIRNPELSEMISCMFADIGLRKKFSNPLFYLKILFS